MKNSLRVLCVLMGLIMPLIQASAAFVRLEDVARTTGAPDPAVLARGRAAIGQIKVFGTDQENYDSCSGTFVSNSGYFLTAIHCLRTCSFVHTKTFPHSNIRYVSPDVSAVKKGKVRCPVTLLSQNQNSQTLARVVATGVGYFDNMKSKDLENLKDLKSFNEFLKTGVGIPGDFAVLKFEGKRPFVCEPMAPAVLDQAVWAIGFPIQTFRPDRYNSPGDRAMYSAGMIMMTPQVPPNYAAATIPEVIELVTHRPGILRSTIDAVPSSSGSGLLDRAGHIVGIVESITPSRAFNEKSPDVLREYIFGATNGVSTVQIQRSIEAMYGTALAEQIFNCQ